MAQNGAPGSAGGSGANDVEIKFVIVPEGFSHTRRFARTMTLVEMKAQIEEDLRIPVASMKLVYEGQGTRPLPAFSGCQRGALGRPLPSGLLWVPSNTPAR